MGLGLISFPRALVNLANEQASSLADCKAGPLCYVSETTYRSLNFSMISRRSLDKFEIPTVSWSRTRGEREFRACWPSFLAVLFLDVYSRSWRSRS
jgi:hypothetical protein